MQHGGARGFDALRCATHGASGSKFKDIAGAAARNGEPEPLRLPGAWHGVEAMTRGSSAAFRRTRRGQ
ncbi:MAG: hypothetical protein WBW81_06240 [Methylocella sp.]